MIGKKNSGGLIKNLVLIASDSNTSKAIINQKKTVEKPRV